MKWQSLRSCKSIVNFCLFAFIAVPVEFLAGCGGSTTSTAGNPAPSGTATLTLIATSTANGKISVFDLGFNTISLISKSGATVNLLPSVEHVEFAHLNGAWEPLISVAVPQDTYTSATASIGPADFVCLGAGPEGGNATAIYDYGYTPASNVAIHLPKPLEVADASPVLLLDLQVSQSASWSETDCASLSPGGAFSITPTFNLTSLGSTHRSSSGTPNRFLGLSGIISSLNGLNTSFDVLASDGTETAVAPGGRSASYASPSWQVTTTTGTSFQKVSGFAALAVGMPVDFDAVPQADGSLLATRVEVEDADSGTLSISKGPLMVALSSNPILAAASVEAGGVLYTGDLPGDAWGVSYDNATFQISGQVANTSQLPFAATFDGNSLASGQTLSITSHSTSNQPWPIYIPATTITLLPQTINGRVVATSTLSGFKEYTVSLASYDLFPQLAVQNLQTTVLTDPSTVIVYADGNTRMLNAQPIVVGSTVRFNGAIFNDNGTLRMACLQVNDGVPE